MKKLKSKCSLTVMMVFCSYILLAQFNTLTPTVPKKTNNPKIVEQIKEADNPKLKKEKKSWKDVFNITTKAEKITGFSHLSN
jgi:hypothetical protein